VVAATGYFGPLLILWAILAALGAWFTASRQEAWWRVAVVTGAAAATVLTGAGIALIRLPTAVAIGLVLTFGPQAIMISTRDGSTQRCLRPVTTLVAITSMFATLAGVFLGLAGSQGVIATAAINRESQATRDLVISRLAPYRNTPIMGGGWMLDFFSSNPYRATPDRVRLVLPLLSGWSVFSPNWLDQKRQLGLQDTYGDLVTIRDDARPPTEIPLFMGNELLAEATALFISNEMGRSQVVTPVRAADLGAGVYLWNMVSSD